MTEEELKQKLEIERIVKNLNQEGRFDEKIEYCKKGLEIEPDNNYFLSNIGLYYYRTNIDYEKAYLYLRKCVENGDYLPAVKKTYFYSVIQTNRVPDDLDIKLLKGQFDRNGNYCDYHLLLIERYLNNNEVVDPDIISFLILDKINKKDFDNIDSLCENVVKKIPNISCGLKALEYIILAMKLNKNLEKYAEYTELYTKMVYEYPDRISENRINNIKSYNQWLDKHHYIRIK